jgi:sugar diacid utilization regulator/putative methionine-R-sulfoxide reductase with GAF domain
MPASARSRGESRVLYRIISTVGSSLELEEVLDAVVRLLSDASGVHACFVYLLERNDRLVLRAASEPYAGLVGEIVLERGEGLAWWAAERKEPAFIRENALADPRNKFVPELDEERFQSLVSVPIRGRDGSVIGVITMHTEAPREFTKEEVEFLVTSASLVAGAIENARLYAERRKRIEELEHLTELGETIARAETLAELLPAVTARGLRLLRARSCHVYLLDTATDELRLRASTPEGTADRETVALADLGRELSRRRRSRVAQPLVANDELLGLLLAEGTTAADLAGAVANQTAVAIKKIELIEHLTERNLIKDFFEELVRGAGPGELDVRAARLGCDLDEPHVVLVAAPATDELEQALAAIGGGTLLDRRQDSIRALVRVPPAGEGALLRRLRELHAQLPEPVAIGVSNPCAGAPSFAAGFEEAEHALVGTSVLHTEPTVTTYEELGPYKYLLRMSIDSGARDSHREAIRRLAQYDEQRSTYLLRTLEEFLRRRGNISATSDALFVHPNTLRQRLRRIQELSGIDLRKDDWLMLEIALKIVRLEGAVRHTSTAA